MILKSTESRRLVKGGVFGFGVPPMRSLCCGNLHINELNARVEPCGPCPHPEGISVFEVWAFCFFRGNIILHLIGSSSLTFYFTIIKFHSI